MLDETISVIVPVYNTKEYISTCIESILNQTYNNWQLIIVDDGSTDGSLEICKKYARNDYRIKIIENNHYGLIHSRKTGLKYADGKYIVFSDSDDWYEINALQIMLEYIREDVDIVVAGYCDYINDNDIRTNKNKVNPGIYDREELNELIYDNMMFDIQYNGPRIIQSCCSKMFKKNILEKCYQNVNENITLGEDAIITYQALLEANKISVIDSELYFYRRNTNSMCFTKDLSMFEKIACFKDNMREIFERYENSHVLIKQLNYYVLHLVWRAVNNNFEISLSPTYHIKEKQLDNKKIVLYGAGMVGKQIFSQLEKKCKIVKWIDENKKGQLLYDVELSSIDSIKECKQFDYIVVAIKNDRLSRDIKANLMRHGIESDKIVCPTFLENPLLLKVDV